MAGAVRTKSIYSVHPSVAMVQKWIAELPAKTGRTLDEWVALVRKSGPADEKQCREWLKIRHQMGTNAASWIATRAGGDPDKGFNDEDPDSYLRTAEKSVDAMYAGRKSALRPIYARLLKLALALGSDVKACPCKSMVPLYRRRVFAQIKPTTQTRIDLGLALGSMKTPKRLIDTGGFAKKDRITHRIEITAASAMDGELKRWLRTAYDLDA